MQCENYEKEEKCERVSISFPYSYFRIDFMVCVHFLTSLNKCEILNEELKIVIILIKRPNQQTPRWTFMCEKKHNFLRTLWCI